MKRWHGFAAAWLALLGLLIGLALGAVSEHHLRNVYGQRLDDAGAAAYQRLSARGAHEGLGNETPPANALRTAAITAANERRAELQTSGPNTPRPLAAREPITRTVHVQNASSRRGARPAILVVHSTESSNLPGLQDVLAIAAWFNNPRAQASSNYTIDGEGNTLLLVPETEKAWTQAFFNPWSISIEFIGRASQSSWPEAQLRAGARVFAAASARWGIPVRHALVSGCTITRSGILQHNDLGQCGGGHHDAGPAFPIARFIALVDEYRHGGYRPLSAYERWRRWYTKRPLNPRTRPGDAPARIPTSWWRRLRVDLRRAAS